MDHQYGLTDYDWGTGVEVLRLTRGTDRKMKILYFNDSDPDSRFALYRIHDEDTGLAEVRQVEILTGEDREVCSGVIDAGGMALGPEHFYAMRPLGTERYEMVRYHLGTLEEQRAEFEGEPVLLSFITLQGKEGLTNLYRIEEEEGGIARLRAYGFCPETIRAIGEALGLHVYTGLYRPPQAA